MEKIVIPYLFLLLFVGLPIGAMVSLGAYIVFFKQVRLSLSSKPVHLDPAAAYIIGGQLLALGLGVIGFILYVLFG
jgi:hypothetical protein